MNREHEVEPNTLRISRVGSRLGRPEHGPSGWRRALSVFALGLSIAMSSALVGGCASSGAAYRTTELTSATTSDGDDAATSGGDAPKVGKPERSFDLDASSDDSVAPKRPTPSRRSGTFGNWK